MDQNLEIRNFVLETRKEENGALTIEGHPAIYNSLSIDLGGFKERIAPGAFTGTLGRSPDVVFLINHEGLPLARTASDTLTLSETDDGLRMKATVDPDDPDVKRIIPKMRRKDLTKGSFAFRTLKDDWMINKDNDVIRTLVEIELEGGDVSLVTTPAYRETDLKVAKRSMAQWKDHIEAKANAWEIEAEHRARTLALLALK